MADGVFIGLVTAKAGQAIIETVKAGGSVTGNFTRDPYPWNWAGQEYSPRGFLARLTRWDPFRTSARSPTLPPRVVRYSQPTRTESTPS